ncbi:dipeptide ABC transporter ATP-binding protein [Aliirhizobium smilacinae]|uniref:ABC transporter ATP-binding protein n=1 Tax=Aliirhizobium smilacinae TaxID=1395944 RepID=A0A5C4X8G9_9HYPH|nr:ABC transporter ATP-binding protein [Rhizobium smilacinae]TNM59753.1 ABC transporter ATP-binding protein [Rhizobium smilacinae]
MATELLETATTPLLEITGLNVIYRSGTKTFQAVRNLDLSVRGGEFVAIVGQSGSGKSTTAHSIIDILPHGTSRNATALRFNGHDLLGYSEREMQKIRGKAIGFVPQDPTVSLDPVKTIGSQIVEALVAHGLATGTVAADRALSLLDEVGIDRPQQRFAQYPHEISGGMRQRVLIAIALSCGPSLIIADEPTSGLDVTVQRKVLDRIEKLTRERQTAVLFITHDLGIAADRADRIVVMNEGRIVEQGSALDITRRPQENYTRALLADIPPRPRIGAATSSGTLVEAEKPLMEAKALHKQFTSGWFRRSGGIKAVDDVSFVLEKGRTLALVGESGSGKTTTARILAGLTRPTSGEILLDGKSVRTPSGRLKPDYHRDIQFVYQNPFSSLDPRWKIEDIIRDPLKVNRIGDAASQRQRVAELAEAVSLPSNLLQRRAAELSGGQLQRVAIARALSLRPRILVLDEPTSALDVTVQARILSLLQDVQREYGLSYLFVTHDLAVVNAIADRIVVMKSGKVVESGTKQDVLGNPQAAYTQELVAAIPGKKLQPTITATHAATADPLLPA